MKDSTKRNRRKMPDVLANLPAAEAERLGVYEAWQNGAWSLAAYSLLSNTPVDDVDHAARHRWMMSMLDTFDRLDEQLAFDVAGGLRSNR